VPNHISLSDNFAQAEINVEHFMQHELANELLIVAARYKTGRLRYFI
jgi:hypothetical protein